MACPGGRHGDGWFGSRCPGTRRTLLNDKLPLSGCALLVSGRASFELVQKGVLAGVPLLAAVSAPSSLAASLADEAGLTLVGFLRGPSMNVYAGPERLSPEILLSASRGPPGSC